MWVLTGEYGKQSWNWQPVSKLDVYILFSVFHHSVLLPLTFNPIVSHLSLSLSSAQMINKYIILIYRMSALVLTYSTKSHSGPALIKWNSTNSHKRFFMFHHVLINFPQRGMSAGIVHYPFIKASNSARATYRLKEKVKQQNFARAT